MDWSKYSISESADLLGLSCSNISKTYKISFEVSSTSADDKKRKVRGGQRTIDRLVQAYQKEKIPQH